MGEQKIWVSAIRILSELLTARDISSNDLQDNQKIFGADDKVIIWG